jgi:hypothetical protein
MLSVQSRSTVWTLDYSVGNNPARFTPLVTFADPGVFGTTHRDISLGTTLDGKGSNVWIRVVALNGSTGSGSRDTFALDNFSISWTTAPAITAWSSRVAMCKLISPARPVTALPLFYWQVRRRLMAVMRTRVRSSHNRAPGNFTPSVQ